MSEQTEKYDDYVSKFFLEFKDVTWAIFYGDEEEPRVLGTDDFSTIFNNDIVQLEKGLKKPAQIHTRNLHFGIYH